MVRVKIYIFLLLVMIVDIANGQDTSGDGESDIGDTEETSGKEDESNDEESSGEDESNEEESSGDIEASDEEENNSTEVTVLRSAYYNMGTINSASLTLRMDQVDGKENLHMICNMDEKGKELATSDCPPLIYLVSGHPSCGGLTESVSAQELAHITSVGEGEVEVDVTWNDLRGSCMTVLQKKSCSGEDEEGSAVIEEGDEDEENTTKRNEYDEYDRYDEYDEEASNELVRSNGSEQGDNEDTPERASKDVVEDLFKHGIDWDRLTIKRSARRLLGSQGSLSRPKSGLGRIFSTINLANFNLLSVGTTGVFNTVSKTTVVSSANFGGILVTNHDPLSTWPIIQLPGVTSAHVFGVLLGLAFLVYTYTVISAPSSFPAKQRIIEVLRRADLQSRVDALGVGVVDLLRRTAIDTPYKFLDEVATKIDRGLLRPTRHRNRFSKEGLIEKIDENIDDTEDVEMDEDEGSYNTYTFQGNTQEDPWDLYSY